MLSCALLDWRVVCFMPTLNAAPVGPPIVQWFPPELARCTPAPPLPKLKDRSKDRPKRLSLVSLVASMLGAGVKYEAAAH